MVSGRGSPNSREGDDASVPDPTQIDALPQLAAALNMLRRGRSYAALDRAVGGRAKAPVLRSSTLSDLVNGKSVPSKDTIITFLTACGLTESEQHPWLAAWERVDTGHLRRPAGAVRVRAADARLLGVHRSIQVDPGVEDFPVYVPRDVDADLRTAVTAATVAGGFVLVKGSSSVGKTRALVEAVKAVCPDWWLLHPVDAAAVRALAGAPAPRTVVWLDELQRYLTQPGGVPAGAVRALLTAKLLVAATLWPGEYTVRTALRSAGQPDPYAEDRELLRLARIIEVPDTFSGAERARAEHLAADQRIQIALHTTDAGVTQVLAAGPELIRWWEHADITDARQCYGKAVITAALDARRVGATAPLTRDYLTAAAPAYLSRAQQAMAPPDWFDHAVGYATTRLHGATACLTPVAADIGQTAGWTTADYLYQHARQVRRTEPLPDRAWQALAEYHHPVDTTRLAGNAERRNQHRYAEVLYRHAADAGDNSAAERLAALLAERCHVEELRRRADAGDDPATERLADLLAERGHIDELRQRADAANDWYTADRLADLLAKQLRIDELRQRADAGDSSAAVRWAELLAGNGRPDEAITVLRRHADAGDDRSAAQLVDLLAEHGCVEELRQRADGGDDRSADRLVDLLAGLGLVDEAIIMLRERTDTGDAWFPFFRLAALLAERGHVDELRRRADAGDDFAAAALAALLAERGHVDELRQRADAGDRAAAKRLADLLAKQGHIDEAITMLRRRAGPGHWDASLQLADLLAEQNRTDELRQRADAGDWPAAYRLTELLAEQRRIHELEQEVLAGTPGAANRLTALCRAAERD